MEFTKTARGRPRSYYTSGQFSPAAWCANLSCATGILPVLLERREHGDRSVSVHENEVLPGKFLLVSYDGIRGDIVLRIRIQFVLQNIKQEFYVCVCFRCGSPDEI